jgi:filamentous hemagglutinin
MAPERRLLVGSGTQSEADNLGKIWVGDGHTVASDGKSLISADGTRIYRPPAIKKNAPAALNPTGVQANFVTQSINPITKQATVTSNAHLSVTP